MQLLEHACCCAACVCHRTDVPQIKIGRRGATEALIGSIHAVWRNHECVKLRIHDDKVGRETNSSYAPELSSFRH